MKDKFVPINRVTFLDYVIEGPIPNDYEHDYFIISKGKNVSFNKFDLLNDTPKQEQLLIFKHFIKLCLEYEFKQPILLDEIEIGEQEPTDDKTLVFYTVYHKFIQPSGKYSWANICISLIEGEYEFQIDFDTEGYSTFLYFKSFLNNYDVNNRKYVLPSYKTHNKSYLT